MENASKALIIAGGVLISLMLLSLVVYVFTSISHVADSQDRKTEAEQIETFNKSYEAYNKRKMYGADVITVVNKAITYNKGIEQNEKINIELILNTNFSTTTVVETIYASGEKETGNSEYSGTILNAGTYTLLGGNGQDIVNFFSQEPQEQDKSKIINDTTNYKEIKHTYSGITNFKRAIFECTGIDYNASGRINYMCFTQQ